MIDAIPISHEPLRWSHPEPYAARQMNRDTAEHRAQPNAQAHDFAGRSRGCGGILRQGGLVAFPTETVYGLGADGRSAEAVAALYAAKARPRFNPLIAHVESLDGGPRRGDVQP